MDPKVRRPLIAPSLAMAAALAMASLLVAPGCNARQREPDRDRPRDLAPGEVREYRGERLDSADDFRENSIEGPQEIDIAKYRLRVDGLVDERLSLTYDQVTKEHDTYRKVLTLDCVEGWSAKVLWEGVLVRDLLEEAGVKPQARTVIFHAADGYTTSFPVSYFDRDILLAHKMNDVPLPVERGFPFQLAAEDKWGYKWCRWVTRIELSDDEDYEGYWERRGYSNGGDRDKSFFGE